MNIHEKLNQLLKERGWTRYRLAKESGLSEATITNIFTRNNTPTVGTIEVICKGMGISLSQFFSENDMVELTPELKVFYKEWTLLTDEQKDAVIQIMRVMNKK